MVELKEAIENMKDLERQLDEKNVCFKILEENLGKESVSIDVYYSAKAFTSIINTLVNKKIEYAQHIIDCQIEILGFLNTYDDKYLSNLSNMIVENTTSEFYFVNNLLADIEDLKDFLQAVLVELVASNEIEISDNVQQYLDEMLEEFNKKYGGENYEE